MVRLSQTHVFPAMEFMATSQNCGIVEQLPPSGLTQEQMAELERPKAVEKVEARDAHCRAFRRGNLGALARRTFAKSRHGEAAFPDDLPMRRHSLFPRELENLPATFRAYGIPDDRLIPMPA